jgi:hypothetical protein
MGKDGVAVARRFLSFRLSGKSNGPRNLKLLAERKLELDMTRSVDGKVLPPGFPRD